MPALTFSVDNAEALPFAATPTIVFRLRVTNAIARESIRNVGLRCQIMIEPSRRRYDPAEREKLLDLFGEPDRWSQTLRPLLWTHAGITVPEFTGGVSVELPVACTFDFNVAGAKYFHALENQDVPLCFQFSGTVFFSNSEDVLQIAQIEWDKEARFRLPATVWHEMMDHYYPNSAWLRLSRDTFDRLYEYKRRHGFATWEQALEHLLPAEKKAAS